jgi:hypothetical protein
MDNMKTYYLNTGVRPFDHDPPAGMASMKGFVDSGNGTYIIPFDCEEVPEGAKPFMACDSPDLKKEDNDVIVREMFNSRLLSKYVYFRLSKS